MTAERTAKWLLRIVGVASLSAVFAVVMPTRWMAAVHQAMGLGEMPTGPIVEYLTRSCSAMYAVLGALYLYLSFDVRRHRPVIRFLAAASLVFGFVMLGLDLAIGMPLHWAAVEGPIIIAYSVVMLAVIGRAPAPSR